MKNTNILYFVEGEDEKALITTLKKDLRVIQSGKVQVLNVLQNKISINIFRTLKKNTVVILVFDTDTENTDILTENIKALSKCSVVSKVITIPQVKNLEDELLRSCEIKNITYLLGSRSKKDFKRDLIRATNLDSKLVEHGFNIDLFWSKPPSDSYQEIKNEASLIKIKK